MSAFVMMEINCNEARCSKMLRVWHRSALPLSSMIRLKLRRHGWSQVGDQASSRQHFCADHKREPGVPLAESTYLEHLSQKNLCHQREEWEGQERP